MNSERNVGLLCEKQDVVDALHDRTNKTTRLLLFGYGRVVLRRYKTNSFRDSQNGLLIDMVSSAVDQDRYEPFGKCIRRKVSFFYDYASS